MMSEFADHTDVSRFDLSIDNRVVALIDYRADESTIEMFHTFTEPDFRGHGYAGQLADWAITKIENETELRIVPSCPFIATWFEKHPEKANLLSR